MKRFFVLLAVLLGAVATPSASISSAATPTDRWGALAYSSSTGKTGAAYDFPTRQAADRQALRDCGAKDCKVISAFSNECGALALGKNALGHAGRGSTLEDAKIAALALCQEHGGASCRIIRMTCSSSR